jgi:biopolymer transport protein ExbD
MHGGGGGEAVSPTPGKRGALKKTKIEIIPMIDTMFFLLVFFILSSIGALKLQGINLQMPRVGGADPNLSPDKNPPLNVMINIKADGQMFVGTKPVLNPDGIGDLIEQQAVKDQKIFDGDKVTLEKELKRAIVTVNADPQATHEMVIKAIDEARKLKRTTEDPDPKNSDAALDTHQEIGASLINQFAIANSVDTSSATPAPAGS